MTTLPFDAACGEECRGGVVRSWLLVCQVTQEAVSVTTMPIDPAPRHSHSRPLGERTTPPVDAPPCAACNGEVVLPRYRGRCHGARVGVHHRRGPTPGPRPCICPTFLWIDNPTNRCALTRRTSWWGCRPLTMPGSNKIHKQGLGVFWLSPAATCPKAKPGSGQDDNTCATIGTQDQTLAHVAGALPTSAGGLEIWTTSFRNKIRNFPNYFF